MNAPISPSDQMFYEPILEMTRKFPGEAPFKTAWQAGRSLSLEQAVAFALA